MNLLKEMRSRTGKKIMLWLTTIREQKKKKKKKMHNFTIKIQLNQASEGKGLSLIFSIPVANCTNLSKPNPNPARGTGKQEIKSTPLQQSIEVISWLSHNYLLKRNNIYSSLTIF